MITFCFYLNSEVCFYIIIHQVWQVFAKGGLNHLFGLNQLKSVEFIAKKVPAGL